MGFFKVSTSLPWVLYPNLCVSKKTLKDPRFSVPIPPIRPKYWYVNLPLILYFRMFCYGNGCISLVEKLSKSGFDFLF